MRAAIRILSTLFGVQNQGDAAAHAATQALIQSLIQKVQTMSDKLQAGLDQLKADVTAQGDVIASATTAFQGLSKQLADALAAAKAAGATDTQLAELTALQQGVEANTTALAAAIPQNTPAAGGGTPTPAPSPAPVDPNAPAGTATAPTPGQPT